MGDRRRQLAESWSANAAAWTRAVRAGAIASRRLATDAAMVAALAGRRPRRVLDLGCGEGWLARALAGDGIAVVGLDAAPELIEAARQAGGGSFHLASYADIVARPTHWGEGFDGVAANFALLDDDPAPVLAAVRTVLAPGGALVVQTLHPLAAGAPYEDGWRTEDFHGFGEDGQRWRPMPWYFRTLESWLALLRRAGYRLDDLREPRHPQSGQILSLLLTASPAA